MIKQNMNYSIQYQWDEEAQVWIATSEDAPGLILKSETIHDLIKRVKLIAPELIELDEKRLFH